MRQKSKYMEIYDRLKEEICRGVLASGEKIYSENELMQMFLVSRQTVRQAVSRLERKAWWCADGAAGPMSVRKAGRTARRCEAGRSQW